MQYNVRGGLGNQLLEIMGCYSHALLRGKLPSEIFINVLPTDHRSIGQDYFSRIAGATCKIGVRNGAQKYGVWSRMFLLLDSMAAVREYIWLKESAIPSGVVLHVRNRDRSPISLTHYFKCKADLVIGDDRVLCREIADFTGAEYNEDSSECEDWRLCLGADEIIGPPSSFTLSTLFFNPNKKVKYLAVQDGPKTFPALEAMRLAESYFPNMELVGHV